MLLYVRFKQKPCVTLFQLALAPFKSCVTWYLFAWWDKNILKYFILKGTFITL